MTKKYVTILFLAFSFFTLKAESSAEISENLVITIRDDSEKIPNSVIIDVSQLHFDSAEDLALFCKTFSFDFHEMTGNFDQQKIKIVFNQTKLQNKKVDLNTLNAYFNKLSKRMMFFYNKLEN